MSRESGTFSKATLLLHHRIHSAKGHIPSMLKTNFSSTYISDLSLKSLHVKNNFGLGQGIHIDGRWTFETTSVVQ